MDIFQKSLVSFFNVLFPRDIQVSIFDSLPKNKLEQCAIEHLRNLPFSCIAPLPYKKPLVRLAIQAAKYHSHERAAVLLGETLAPFVAEELAERRMFGSFESVLLIPIPLHAMRLYERGFNQAERIAKALTIYMGDKHLTLDATLLVRHAHTESQAHSTSKTERFANIKGAFSVPFPKHIKKKDIILLDDVITTGATLETAQKALYKAGARNVLCVAVAH